MLLPTERLNLEEGVPDEERAEGRTKREPSIGHARESRKYVSA